MTTLKMFTLSWVVFFIFVFLMQQILEITNMIVNYQVSILAFFLMLVYSMPYFLVFIIPMSVMMSVLLTFLRLSNDNEIVGEVTRTIYVGNALEVYFNVGDIAAEALLDPDSQIKEGDPIHLFAPQDEVMILPIGGVEALRKVPGHPMAESAPPTTD